MMKPAYVSGWPNACANAGDSVLIGSDAKPTAATMQQRRDERRTHAQKPQAVAQRASPPA